MDSTCIIEAETLASVAPVVPSVAALCAELRDAFGVELTLWDPQAERVMYRSANQPDGDELYQVEVARRVLAGPHAEIIDEGGPLVVLAIPVRRSDAVQLVAIGTFLIRNPQTGELPPPRLCGLSRAEFVEWARTQEVWSPAALLRVARVVMNQWNLAGRCEQLAGEVEQLSQNLTNTYEEICLLYGVTQNLRISATDEELACLAMDWLSECMPAQAIAIQYLPLSAGDEITYRTRTETAWLTAGNCPLGGDDFARLIATLDLGPGCGPIVLNRSATGADGWQFPDVRELIIVPLAEGQKVFGWLAAINCTNGLEFGTVEASLLNSVAAILGIHTANRELYRQQAEFLASVVRALTSAIDAKDPYTCGHSDRVARIAVRIAREMRCSSSMLHTLYMAGLLHDIGKIGIDDNVLRKPGRLTQAEFEHIKQHPELGYRILSDLKQLSEVLPVVLHHHEQWDGKGYPAGLKADDTPLLARITAVADAFDAMTSDRPYRKGLPIEKVEQIFREGAGFQWDAAVIDAYFRCRDDVLEISRRERANLSLDIEQWRD